MCGGRGVGDDDVVREGGYKGGRGSCWDVGRETVELHRRPPTVSAQHMPACCDDMQ